MQKEDMPFKNYFKGDGVPPTLLDIQAFFLENFPNIALAKQGSNYGMWLKNNPERVISLIFTTSKEIKIIATWNSDEPNKEKFIKSLDEWKGVRDAVINFLYCGIKNSSIKNWSD